jgi:hypothetical protein
VGLIPGQFKPRTRKLVFAASPLNIQYEGVKVKTGWLGIRIMDNMSK